MTKTYTLELTEEQVAKLKEIIGTSVLEEYPNMDWWRVKDAIKAGTDLTGDTYKVTFATGEEKGREIYYSPTHNPYGEGFIFVPDRLLDNERPIDGEDNLFRWLDTEFKSWLPQTLQDVLSPNIDGHDIFLPHEMEIFGTNIYAKDKEYGKYKKWDCFTDRESRKFERKGDYDWYWTCSPYVSYSASFCFVYSYGSPGNYSASDSFGVLPCFLITP